MRYNKRLNPFLGIGVYLIIAFVVFGCGGSSESNNKPIIDNTDKYKAVKIGLDFNLNKIFITEASSQGISYDWSLISSPVNSNSTLTIIDAKNTLFNPDVAGEYTFNVAISDEKEIFYTKQVKIKALYNIIVILTDDQRWDTLWAMPITRNKLVTNGKLFKNAFSTTPVCCPFRASFLSCGFYPKNTGVLTNKPDNGGMSHFNESDTIATVLNKSGYVTGFIGKYMHGYSPGHFPPGWNRFVANENGGMLNDWFNLYNVTYGTKIASTEVKIVPETTQYLTDFQKNEELSFLEQFGSDSSPFFTYLAFYAPHSPSTAAPGEENLFSDYFFTERGVGEQDLSDKPSWVYNSAEKCDYFPQKQLRSLQPVDRAIGEIYDWLAQHDLIDKTVIIFTSDNGMMYGEHGLCDKGWPYEESIRVPLVVSMPGIVPGEIEQMIAVNLDVPATIMELTNFQILGDGTSLLPLLRNEQVVWRDQLYLEAYRYLDYRYNTSGLWAGYRVQNDIGTYKYIEHGTGEIEFYDLTADEFELENVYNDQVYKDIISNLSSQLQQEKGISIATLSIPSANIGEKYFFKIPIWGGKEPIIWNLDSGSLPRGINFDNTTGIIYGTPLDVGENIFSIRITSDAIARHANKKQTFVQEFNLKVLQ